MMPPEDAEATVQAGEKITAAMQITKSTTGIFLSPDERHGRPMFDGAGPELEGLAVQFAH